MAFHNDSFLAVQKSHFHYVYFPKSDGLLKSLGHLSDSPTSSKQIGNRSNWQIMTQTTEPIPTYTLLNPDRLFWT